MKEILGYALDAFVIACMTALVMLNRCEMKDFFLIVSPIVAIRVWQVRNGGPPSGLSSSAVLFFFLPFVALLLPKLRIV